MIENIERNDEDIIKEIREKIKKNPKYSNPCRKEFQEDIKRYKFENGNKFINWMQQNGILKNPTDIKRDDRKKSFKNMGFEGNSEYNNYLAQKKGYKNHSEHVTAWRWNTGRHIPMSENENCACYLGIYIGEDIAKMILTEIFGGIENILPYGHPWYEYIVKGGYKINVKTVTLEKGHNCWMFHIEHNHITDYFLLIAFDDIQNKNIMHVLLIEKNEMIRKGKSYTKKERFYDRTGFTIPNNQEYLKHFQKYDWINKLKCIKDLQDKLDILKEEEKY